MTAQLRIAPSGPPAGGLAQPIIIGAGMQIRQVEAGVSSGGLTLTTTYQQLLPALQVELPNPKPYYYYSATIQTEGHSLATTGGVATVQLRGSYDDFATEFVLATLTQTVGGVNAGNMPDRPVGAHAIMTTGALLATPMPVGAAKLSVRAYALAAVANTTRLEGSFGNPGAWLRLSEYSQDPV